MIKSDPADDFNMAGSTAPDDAETFLVTQRRQVYLEGVRIAEDKKKTAKQQQALKALRGAAELVGLTEDVEP